MTAGVRDRGGRRVVSAAILTAVSAGMLYVGWLIATWHMVGWDEGSKLTIKDFGVLLVAVGVVGALSGAGQLAWLSDRVRRERRGMREWLGNHEGGFATRAEIRRRFSAHAMRVEAKTTRPSLTGDAPWWRRRWRDRIPVEEVGVRIGTTITGPRVGRRVYNRPTNLTGVFAPPQTGKTTYLACSLATAPGAAVATSTKADLYDYTAAMRSKLGPILTFDPEGILGRPSDLRWNPVIGCADLNIAIERADHMVGASVAKGVADEGFWSGQAAKVLRCLLHAAALADFPAAKVGEWVANPSSVEPLRILEDFPTPLSWRNDLGQLFYGQAERTRDSIYLTLSRATAFLADPAASLAVQAGPRESFNVAEFLASSGTLYILGSGRQHNPIAPLVTALTGYVFDEAKRLADGTRRLDPWLTMTLDELAQIVRVPLADWAADSAGRGIHLVYGVQSPSQLFEAYGVHGGQTITNSSTTKIFFGGFSVSADLEEISRLCGDRESRAISVTEGTSGSSRTAGERFVRTLPTERIRQLPEDTALVLERATSPAIVRVDRIIRRSVRRRVERTVARMARRRAVAEPITAPTDLPTLPEQNGGTETPSAMRAVDLTARNPR